MVIGLGIEFSPLSGCVLKILIFFKTVCLNFVSLSFYVCMPSWVYMHHVYADACRSEARVSDPFELELEMVVNFLVWVLGQTQALCRSSVSS